MFMGVMPLLYYTCDVVLYRKAGALGICSWALCRSCIIQGVANKSGTSYNKLTCEISGIYVSQLMFWDILCKVDPSNNLVISKYKKKKKIVCTYQFKCAIILLIILIDASYMMNVPLLFETPWICAYGIILILFVKIGIYIYFIYVAY